MPTKFPLTIVLDHVRSAYNVGSVMRTAACAGASRVVTVGYSPDGQHKKVRKTALGAEEMLETIHFESLEEAIERLEDEGQEIYAIEIAENAKSIWEHKFKPGVETTIILGHEVDGLDLKTIDNYNISILQIPMPGSKQSINVASSAAIAIFEYTRQVIPT